MGREEAPVLKPAWLAEAAFVALFGLALAAPPATANVGDTFAEAKARVRARQDVAVVEFWLAKSTNKVVRERWRTNRDAGWTYAEAGAICRAVLNGRKPVTALHHGLGPLNGATMYYDMLLEMDAHGDPLYGGLVRADYEHTAPGRVAAINIHGPDYVWFPEFEDRYKLVIHYVADNVDEE